MNKTAPFFQADGKGQPPLSGGTEALPSALSEEKPFDTYEVVARLKDMMLEDIARKKKAFLKDPAGYAISMRGSSGNGQEEKELTSEMRASRHMATQSYLANGLEGFTPKVLTASEAAKAKAVLADDKTPNAAKIKSLVQLHGTYGSLGDTALDELELAPAVRAAVDLAIQNPRQETFAAEFLGAAALPERQRDEAANRLALLAGTNPEANETLALLMADHGKLDDSNAVQVAGPAAAPDKTDMSFMDKAALGVLGLMKGQTELETPKAAIHGGIKAANAALDLAYDGMDFLKKEGWLDGEITADRLKLPNLPDPKTPAGKMVSSISQFLVGFKGVDKVFKGIKAASYGANAVKNTAQSFITDFTFFDGQEERLSNLIQKNPTLANPINEFLAADPSDGKAWGRLKNALEGLGIGSAGEALAYGVRLVKAGRAAKELQKAHSPVDEAMQDVAGKQAAMKDREPAVVLTGKEFAATEPKALRLEVTDWYKTNLAGTSGSHQSLGEFRFGGSAGKPISKSADIRKLQVFPELKKIIETSEHVASSGSIKAKHSGSGMEYHYTRNTVKIGDELVDVGMVLRKDQYDQLYYDHMIHDMQAIKDAPWASPAVVNPLSPMGTNGPKGTRGDHPALHGALEENIGGGNGEVNLFILGVRSLRGVTGSEQSQPK